jgi:hypothetical protein
MTAINAFFTYDEMFAYLACDGAAFNYADGKVTALGSKVSMFPEYGIVWAMAGPNLSAYIAEHVCQGAPLDQRGVLRLMQEAFIECRSAMKLGKPEGEASFVNDMTIIAAVYLEGEARPAIYRIASCDKAMPDCPVNEWHEIEGTIQPPEVPAYIKDRGMFLDDAVTDCRAVFRAQRHAAFPGMNGAVAVAGTCQLYRVGPDGIKAWDILDFGEQIGDRANLVDQGTDVLRRHMGPQYVTR